MENLNSPCSTIRRTNGQSFLTRSRHKVTSLAIALTMVLTLLGGSVSSALAHDATPDTGIASPAALGDLRLEDAVNALIAAQGEDGGFLGFSGESDPGTTIDAIFALAAAEEAGLDTGDSIERAIAYLEPVAVEYAAIGLGQQAKLVLAIDAAQRDATDFAGTDFWEVFETTEFETGIIGQGFFDHSLATLAAVAVESESDIIFATVLVNWQLPDGSWGFESNAVEGEGDVNTTALAVQALVAAGLGDDPAVDAALDYLAAARATDGGYGYAPAATPEENESDANSTALVIQALLAVGMDPSEEPMASDIAALATFQNESGSFRYNDDMPDDNLFSLVQAILAAAGAPDPVFDDVDTAADLAA